MRTSIALAVAAATAVSANCNPSYNVPTSTACFTACNVEIGNNYVSGWTMDSSSANFIPSLKLMCDKSGANYSNFMMYAGMCMIKCTGDDPELFNAEWAGACAWYAQHANDVCATETTTTAAAVTTTTAPGATTTAATTAATSAPVVASSSVPAASSGVPAASSGVPAASSGVVASGTSAIANGTNSVSAPHPIPTGNTDTVEGAASKLQIGGLAMALVAGAGYLAL